MAGNEDSRRYWFLPSISDVIFVVVLSIIISGKANLLGDADTGYHIRTGEYIIQNFKVPDHDIFSFIYPPIKWTAHEWLSEVFFALIHKVSGLSGVFVATAIVIASVFLLLFRFLKSSGVSIIIAALVVALATSVSTIHWLARPHIFSLLLTLIWYMILDTYQYNKKNYLYLLPPLMLLWVNLHGGFIAGFMLLAVYVTGNLVKAIFIKEERHEASAHIKMFLLISFICLLVALVNPKGYKILLFPVNVISNRFMMDHVIEYLSPNFHTDLRFEYMLLLMILVFGISVLRLNVIETTLVLLFTHMSLFSARYIPLYAIILSPVIGKRIDNIIEALRERRLIKRFLAISARAAVTDSRTKWHLWPFSAAAMVVFLVFTGKIEYSFDKKELPVDAVKFMKREKLPGHMFNNDVFGSYIIYAASPEYKVIFDGRSDMYGEERMREYLKVIKIETGWDKVFRKYDINWIIYNANSTLSNFLLQRNDWRLIYADKVANIFIRNMPDNQPLINRYPDVKPVVIEDKSKADG